MSGDGRKGSGSNSAMMRAAAFIVDKRMLFFLIYILAMIFSLVAMNWVEVNNDITDYLPASTETQEGMQLMEEEFTTYGSASVMVSNISFADALYVQELIEGVKGVSSVTFTEEDADQEDFEAHYNDGAALYSVSFDYDEDDDRALESLALVEEALSGYDAVSTTTMGNQTAEIIDEEISKIMVLACFVVVGVLLLTTRSLGEIPVLCLTLIASLVINKGTNFLCGEISFVSNSVTAILQLALSIDYSIIFVNRYKEELDGGYEVRDAVVVSLAASIPEILSSSLTTICGLFAMMFMQFTLGGDMAVVLIKSILLSLLSVFTLMPGLLVVFSGLMARTAHRDLIPKISFLGRFAYRSRHVMTVAFCFLFVLAFLLSQSCPYVYGYHSLETFITNDQQEAEELMDATFGSENMLAVVVPHGDYEAEAALIADMEAREDVDSCVGLANTEAMDGYMLTDALTPRQFSELLDLEYEVAELLYSVYAADGDEYGRIVGGVSSYEIPLMDMLMFVYEMSEEGYVSLEGDLGDTLKEAYDAIVKGRAQLEGEDYDRILVYLGVPLPEEDESTFDTVEELHALAASYYESEISDGMDVYVVGDSTSQRDLRDSFEVDNIVVTVISMLFVLIVLLFTFKSAGLPVLLILVIEGAISMNFAYPTLTGDRLFFISYLIVSSIQMGANIDYAIVMSTRYTEERDRGIDRQEAIIDALNCAFPTILTSGSMMICAGAFIGVMTSDACIAGIGQCIARGTSISVVLVLFVLPQLLVCGDRLIRKTRFEVYHPVQEKREIGEVHIKGTINGTVNGTIVGTVDAVIVGEVNAVVVSGKMENRSAKESSGAGDVMGNQPAGGPSGAGETAQNRPSDAGGTGADRENRPADAGNAMEIETVESLLRGDDLKGEEPGDEADASEGGDDDET